MSLRTAIASARLSTVAALQDAYPGEVTIGGLPYAAAVTVSVITPEWDGLTGTNKIVQTGTVIITKDVMPEQPARSSSVAYDGLLWTIEGINGSVQDATAWTIRIRRIVSKSP